MKLEVNDGIVRGLPLAILVTFLVQGSTLVWWVLAKARDNHFLEQRVTTLELAQGKASELQSQTMQRLARIEERLVAQGGVLERIERNVGGK